jgi:DNA processing protein
MTPGLALSCARLPGVGRRRLQQMLAAAAGRRIASAAELADFALREAQRLRFASPDAAASARAWDDGHRLAESCARRGWHVLVLGSPNYPGPLLGLDDPPALLFVQGGPLTLEPPRLAIIGTREPSEWGARTARDCAVAAARAGAIVVAGLAWGVDTEAHSAVVAHRGRTWAMLPGALDIIYPDANRALAQQMVERGGALVSEYWPGTRAQPTFFVERDRLQAALADAVVVIETGQTGGTMHTVRFARELRVPLYVTLPAEVAAASPEAAVDVPDSQQGTRSLRRQGVPLIDAAGIPALVEAIRLGRAARPAPPADPQGRLFG